MNDTVIRRAPCSTATFAVDNPRRLTVHKEDDAVDSWAVFRGFKALADGLTFEDAVAKVDQIVALEQRSAIAA